MTAAESMRGEIGTYGSKRRRKEMDRREEWEVGQDESGDTRARAAWQSREQQLGSTQQEERAQQHKETCEDWVRNTMQQAAEKAYEEIHGEQRVGRKTAG